MADSAADNDIRSVQISEILCRKDETVNDKVNLLLRRSVILSFTSNGFSYPFFFSSSYSPSPAFFFCFSPSSCADSSSYVPYSTSSCRHTFSLPHHHHFIHLFFVLFSTVIFLVLLLQFSSFYLTAPRFILLLHLQFLVQISSS
jgi:hypothetical protein